MYCKHCYRMIPDGTDICPACGKSQQEKKNPQKIFLKILLGIAVWFCSMIAIAIIGTSLDLQNSEGAAATLYPLFIAIVPVLLAFKVAAPEMMNFKKPEQPTYTIDSRRRPPVTMPVVPLVDSSKEADPSASGAAAHPVADKYHTETIHPHAEAIEVTSEKTVAPNSVARAVTPVTHKVAGIQYRMDSIMQLASENPDYDMSKREIIDCGMTDERIWKYSFCALKTELIPEPDNPHDPNAIKVMVNGLHVGYIKAGSCSKVHKAIREDRIRGIDCTIGGGPYKIVEENDEDSDTDYTLYRASSNYSVTLTVYQSPK